MARRILIALLVSVSLGALARGTTPQSVGDQLLTFIQSAAELFGKGIVQLLNLVLPQGREVGPDLVAPLGYLGLITVVLLLFGILEAARQVIWIVVIVGWVLLGVRIVLDALRVR